MQAIYAHKTIVSGSAIDKVGINNEKDIIRLESELKL